MTALPPHLCLKSSRYMLTGVICFLIFCVAGCVGRRDALTLSNTLINSSGLAAKAVDALHQAALAETNAHVATRETLIEVHEAWFRARQELALANLRAAFQAATNRVCLGRAAEEAALTQARFRAHERLAGDLKAALLPLDEKIAELLEKARAAQAAVSNAPGDLRLLANRDLADKQYLSALGLKIETDRDAWRDTLRSLDDWHQQALANLAAVAGQQLERVQLKYESGTTSLSGIQYSPLQLGDPPRVNSNVYSNLIAYQGSVQRAGEAMKDYLVLNSFGSGSFLDSFLRQFGSGFVDAVPFIGSGRGVEWSEVKDAAQPLFQSVVSMAKDNLAQAETTALGALSATRESAVGKLDARLNDLLLKITETGRKRLIGTNQ